jgi:hypothetical protein
VADVGGELDESQTITEITRRGVFDLLRVEKIEWWGRLEEIEFLERLWRLDSMPSQDARFPTALGDISMHRITFYDWEDDWIFDDERLGLKDGEDKHFLSFLCETVHPAVRPDRNEADRLVRLFNAELAADGWALTPMRHISGRPVYGPVRITGARPATSALPLDEYRLLNDPRVIEEHLRRIEAGLRADPAAAIGSSKELVEAVCRIILVALSVEAATSDDLLDLYKKVAKELNLNAEAVPDSAKGSQAAQGVLRALVTVVQRLAELRNELGIGHGRARRSAAEQRHGQLAFDSASTVVRFILRTWHDRDSASA